MRNQIGKIGQHLAVPQDAAPAGRPAATASTTHSNTILHNNKDADKAFEPPELLLLGKKFHPAKSFTKN